MKMMLYKEGLVRFGTAKYELAQFDNKFMHLTNSSINKYSPLAPGAPKWTFAQLNTHLRELRKDPKILWLRIRSILVLALLPMLSKVPLAENCFELLGLDVLVDDKFRPWLLEINASPALTVDGSVDTAVKPPMIKDLIKVLTKHSLKLP